jgi:hypothetical protein
MKGEIGIPGELKAIYQDGEIVGWRFSEAAADAGYFGPSAYISSVEGEDEPGVFEAAEAELGLEDVEGKFWSAVHRQLGQDANFIVKYSE